MNKTKSPLEKWQSYCRMADPEAISFIGGVPNAKFLSVSARRMKKVLRGIKDSEWVLKMGYENRQGLVGLREKIAKLYAKDGVEVSAQEILVTGGSQQAIKILADNLVGKTDKLMFDNFTYVGVKKPFADRGAELVEFSKGLEELSEEEIRLEMYKVEPKVLYLVADNANPKGWTMPENKRKAIAKAARELGTVVIDDQAYRYLSFEKKQKMFLQMEGKQVSIGSLSKVLSPGIRIGWLVCKDQELMERLKMAKEAFDLSGSSIDQLAAAKLMNEVFSTKNLRLMTDYYRKNMELAIKLLKEGDLPFEVSMPTGGFYLWLKGKSNFDSKEFFKIAQERGVSVVPGEVFGENDEARYYLRLSVSTLEAGRLKEGVARLAAAVRGERLEWRDNDNTKVGIRKRIKRLFGGGKIATVKS